jgi:ABC-type Na+ efflux pump permease subunit
MAVRSYRPPGNMRTIWLIARRAASESLRDRLTLLVSLFFAIVLPLGLVLFVVRPLADGDDALLGTVLGVYLLLVGLMPAVSAVGIAAGQFAGEKERGVLTPLLASPASNIAIFGGKVLGAIMPPLTYAVVGDSVYLIGVAVVLGPDRLGLIPLALAIAMLILVPAMTAFAATVASLISSRVRTFNAAQQLAGLVLMPVWGVMLGVAIKLPEWGNAALFAALLALVLVDGALLAVSAATWRREEVLSHG